MEEHSFGKQVWRQKVNEQTLANYDIDDWMSNSWINKELNDPTEENKFKKGNNWKDKRNKLS